MASGDEANRGDLTCPECGGKDFTEKMIDGLILYGPKEIELPVTHPVVTCEDCGFECTDERAEWARHCAVRDYKQEQR